VSVRLIAAADCAPAPWLNGGGLTRDLVLAPACTPGGPRFDWRLSLADIDRDGPFSPLPGIDRVFALIDGRLTLAFRPPGPAAPSPVAGGAAEVAAGRRPTAGVRRRGRPDRPDPRRLSGAQPDARPRALRRCDAAIGAARRRGARARLARG